MRFNRGFRRLVTLAILLCGLAPAARAADMLECKVLRQTVGGRDAPASAIAHMVTVDAFRDIVMFDDTILGLNRIDHAVISGWGDGLGVHGEERLSLRIDRPSGTFQYSILTDEQPRFSRRWEGHCEPAKFEPDF
jgi:hypothetical protein